MPSPTDIVFIGLAITSSWGNGHATTYRSLIKGLHACGRRVLFLERDQPWYADHRDAPSLPYCTTQLYSGLADLKARFADRIRRAHTVIVGSYVQDGRAVCDWVLATARGVRAFYDIDTPVTLARLAHDDCTYLRADQVPAFDLMLSFTGGPALSALEESYGAERAAVLYCSVDPDAHRPHAIAQDAALGYMGTYSVDREAGLERLLNEPARALPDSKFLVVGAQYPSDSKWPNNVQRIEHLPPDRHACFYSRQRFTLNLTREPMKRIGFSPSVRLFEAAACGTPIISDEWPGMQAALTPGEEILIARTPEDVVACIEHVSDGERARIASRARERVMAEHSHVCRARDLIELLDLSASARRSTPKRRAPVEKRSWAP